MGPWTKPLISLKSHSYDPGPYSYSPHGIPYLSCLWTGRSRMWAGMLLPNPGQLSTVPGGNTPHSTKPFQPSQQAKGQAVSVRGQHGQQLPSYCYPYSSKYISNWSAMTQQVLRHTTKARLIKGATLAPGVQWGWESCGGQPPVSTLLPYYQQVGESGRVTDLQDFQKEAEMQGFFFPFNVKSLFLNVSN